MRAGLVVRRKCGVGQFVEEKDWLFSRTPSTFVRSQSFSLDADSIPTVEDQNMADQNETAPRGPIRVYLIQLWDGDRVADQWHSNIKPWDLGTRRCQFIDRDSGITVTVEGNFTIDRVSVAPKQ